MRTMATCTTLAAMMALGLQARGDSATAEALFREGRKLMNEGKHAQACPKLEESYRADPATGALLALGVCYERWGKTASAWTTYSDAAARARREGDADREAAARERAQALESELSRITVRVPDAVARLPGLRILRNGEPVGRGAWNTGVPIDPGVVNVEARARGRRSWRTRTTIARHGEAVVHVPLLEADAPKVARAEPAPRDGDSQMPFWIAGGAVGGLGVASAVVGAVFTARAASKNEDSMSDCDGNLCGPSGAEDRRDALQAGDIATGTFIAGGTLVAGGLALVFVAAFGGPSEERTGLSLTVSPFGPFALVSGGF